MSYVDEVYSKTVEDNPGEYEFHQAVKEFWILLSSLLIRMKRNTGMHLCWSA